MINKQKPPIVSSQIQVNLTLLFDKVKTQYVQNALHLRILKTQYVPHTAFLLCDAESHSYKLLICIIVMKPLYQELGKTNGLYTVSIFASPSETQILDYWKKKNKETHNHFWFTKNFKI